MKTTPKLLAMAALLLSLAAGAQAQDMDAAKRADIEKLMQLTGAANLGLQMGEAAANQTLNSIRQAKPDVSPRVLEVVRGEVIGLMRERMQGPDGLMGRIIPVYGKYFSHQEIKELIAFYSTPTGAKIITAMPPLMNEAMQLGQQWGMALGPELQARIKAALEKEGLDK